MTQPALPQASDSKSSLTRDYSLASKRTNRKKSRKTPERSDVLVSAVISSYLLTHLHHVLQRAEFSAAKEGRESQAANFAQLRKVLCMDARSMSDASAIGIRERPLDKFKSPQNESNAA